MVDKTPQSKPDKSYKWGDDNPVYTAALGKHGEAKPWPRWRRTFASVCRFFGLDPDPNINVRLDE